MVDIRKLAQLAEAIPADLGGGSTLDKLYVMAGLAARLDLSTYVEIGVYRGRSLLPLAWSFAARGGHSYGIDPYARTASRQADMPSAIAEEVSAFIESTDYDALHGDLLRQRDAMQLGGSCELLRETSTRAVEILRARGVRAGMVHIDGNHDRHQVLADVEAYLTLMDEGSVMVVDDIDWPSVGDGFAHAREKLTPLFETATYAVLIRSNDAAHVRNLAAFCDSLERHALRFLAPGPAPKVSVPIITYNHERFIGQAIESVLAQQTDFEVEIVIAEDCSTDGTLAVCRAYRDRYPDRIHLIERPVNVRTSTNYLETYRDCRGEYVALLEGDDFWIDPHKLRKQVAFLDTHPDYAICFHNVLLSGDDGTPGQPLFTTLPETTTAADLCRGDYIATASCMMRNHLVEIPAWMYTLLACDWPFDILNAERGKIGYIDEPMAVYRRHAGAVWSSLSMREQLITSMRLGLLLDRRFGFRYRDSFTYFLDAVRKAFTVELDREIRNAPGPMTALPPPPPAKQRRRGRVSTARKALQQRWRQWLSPVDKTVRAGETSPVEKAVRAEEAGATPSEVLDLLILDDAYPHPQSSFRREEFDTYLALFERARAFSTGSAFSFFKDKRSIEELIAEHGEGAPLLRGMVRPMAELPPHLRARCGFTVFANNSWVNLDYFEANAIPFVFTLYPGGGFLLRDPTSDWRLRRIFSSPMFRKVIVTQKITLDYLVDNGFCPRERIEFIYGVVTPATNLDAPSPLPRYGEGKPRLDICFTAHKYTPDGRDKGFDIFLDVARALAARFDDCHFHVVGGFGPEDRPLNGLDGRITFYGNREPDWLRDFYRDKDLILLCNVPFLLLPGAFDGFPTACGSDAMLSEVALFCTDPLHLNGAFEDGRDLVLVPHDTAAIVEKLSWYRANPSALRALARSGRTKAARVYSFEAQLAPRLALLQRQIIGEELPADRAVEQA
ncbi:glycosyltransferase [Ancylobacter polymorphus]|uniref:Glycosyltransferase involved in cell wall biosynthesis/predicted O-methyltransferase YrrM n=1 Tax=Ancylobacter polymorphus TaxID=223390 RepID=A0ABU0BFM3_9HYPH|nr:glycosyltransferase [Ancylobacter polymorphus]MDQ0304633.1 glycosyltransferase involved in cell wall biosynthesis/predicted O-methyltransferase YrrM [Ancylobacter polymorphus]